MSTIVIDSIYVICTILIVVTNIMDSKTNSRLIKSNGELKEEIIKNSEIQMQRVSLTKELKELLTNEDNV